MKNYITTPIYYVNDKPHLGHAYTTIIADILHRTNKLKEEKSYFLTGTDEHGQKIQKSAEKQDKDPKKFCDEVSKIFEKLTTAINANNDDFIRTTEKRHIDFVQKVWSKLFENGWIYKDKYQGWYSIRDEAFYQESEIIDGKAPSGAEVQWHVEESYFFKLSSFTHVLTSFYETHEDFVSPPQRFNEVKSFVSQGLYDLSISRTSFQWGIPVPGDSQHVIYVWLDALFNYISALESKNLKKEFWDYSQKVHVIGKDILRFHSVYWPAFLIAFHVSESELSDTCNNKNLIRDVILENLANLKILSHGWWMVGGQKMSKSLGNVVDPFTLIEKYGSDKLRYFLCRESSFYNDGDFSEYSLIERTNSDLADNIGNLVRRVFTFISKNCQGKIPDYLGKFENNELVTRDLASETINLIESFNINGAIFNIIQFSSIANEFINNKAPWALKKEDKIEEMNDVLYVLCIAIYKIGISLSPIIPNAGEKILAIFGGRIATSGQAINIPEILFVKEALL